MEILKIMEETYLDTYTDIALGEIKVNGFSEIEDEISRRIQRDYALDIRKEMNKYTSEEIKFVTLSPIEIFRSLRQFIVEKYLPETSMLRNEMFLKLSLGDRELIKLGRDNCDRILRLRFDENLKNLSGQEREIKELLTNIELMSPTATTIKNNCPESFSKVYEISSEINSIPEKYAKSFSDLKREKIKIRLGKLGNLISSSVGFSGSNNKDNYDIIELLMIK